MESESLGPLTAFFGGLLTAFTPSVYPVIPLTVAAFGARSGSLGRRAALAALFLPADLVPCEISSLDRQVAPHRARIA